MSDAPSVLSGRRVVVPVTDQRRALAAQLAELGVVVDAVEFIAIAPPTHVEALRDATLRWCAGDYAWMAVTSRNAVLAMDVLARDAGTTLAAPQPHALVAAVGEATLGGCAQVGLSVAFVPREQANAAAMVKEFAPGPGRVLAPLGNLAAPVLPRGLEKKGWHVDAVEAYRTIDGPGPSAKLVADVARGGVDAVVLTSGSVAQRFAQTCPVVDAKTVVVAIGTTTAASATTAGLKVDAVAAWPSYDGVVSALVTALAQRTDTLEAP